MQAPTGLRIQDVTGPLVTLRWNAPAQGPAPTGYVLQAGLTSGAPLVAITTAGTATAFQVTAPPGSFYLRVQAVGAAGPSPSSNEIRLQLGTPTPPSPPAHLAATVNGTELALSWAPTYDGTVPTGVTLEVNGGAASLPIGLRDAVSFSGVAPGAYAVAVRSTGPGGSSAATPPIAVQVPADCASLPAAPRDFLAWVQQGVVRVAWDQPAGGAATTSYLLTVDGLVTIPLVQRTIHGVLPAGVYGLRVRAANGCGTGPATPAQVLVVP